MLSIAHSLTSLPFGAYLEHPLLIFFAAFFFHLLADTLLHWNIYPDEFKKYPILLAGTDILAGVVLSWLLLGPSFFTVPFLVAIAGGNAPDVIQGLWDLIHPKNQKKYFRWLFPLFTFHDHIQLETRNVFHGLLSQVILIMAAIWAVSLA